MIPIFYRIIFIASALFFGPFGFADEYITIYSTTTGKQFPVQTNQVFEVVGYDSFYTPTISAIYDDGSYLGASIWIAPTNAKSQVLTGLKQITVGAKDARPGWVTFKVTTPGAACVISNYIPASAVVIPTAATGNVEVILESSTDLVNWNQANPGIYSSSSATNRFFRVRAQIKP